MKKLLLVTFLFYSLNTKAQMGVAKIKYDEAEEAYTAKNYKLCLEKLDGVVDILKETNPKVQYLRITCISKMIEKNPLGNFKEFVQLSEYYNKYLIDYDNIPDLEEKYKEVYSISEKYKKYPKNEAEYQEVINLRKRGRVYKYDNDSLDYNKAKSFFEQAVSKGDFRSMVELSDMYEKGGPNFSKNDNLVAEYNKLLYEAREPEGLYTYGVTEIYKRKGRPAYDLIYEAAGLNYLPAITLFGIIQFCSYQIERTSPNSVADLEARKLSVIKWFRLAQDNGESSSEFLYYLGKAYALGIMTGTADFTKAVEYFKKSADLGNKKGQNALGFCYMNASGGLSQDVQKAYELFTPAANQVFAAAEYNLSTLYSGFGGFPRDKKQAQYWKDRYSVNPTKCIDEAIIHTLHELY